MRKKLNYLFASSLLALVPLGVSSAQQAAPPVPEAEADIVITGSRIPRPNLEQPTPVATISNAAIENAGTSNLGDIIDALPALTFDGSVRANSDSFGNAGGLNFPDLRSLGTSRTLTLVNGKRHVSGDAGDSAVDLNSIPPALVDRVEVITGGASAIYGSDAVSGVINIITKKQFEGIQTGLEYGRPQGGDYGANLSAYLTGGMNFMDNDRANVTASVFFDKTSQVHSKDISALKEYGTIVNSAPFDGVPDRLIVPWVLSDYIDENGVIYDDNTGLPMTGFTANGTPVAQPVRIGDNSFAFGSFAGPCATCFQLEDWILIAPETQRAGAAGTLSVDLTPQVKYSLDAKYVNTKIYDSVQPSFLFFGYFLDPDNAFITPQIQAVLDANPGNIPFVNRFNADVGARTTDITRETFRIVNSLEGSFDLNFADVDWEISHNFGETKNEFVTKGDLITNNFAAAIDAVNDGGTIKCRVDVPSAWYPGYVAPGPLTGGPCVPFNLFGQQNSQAAIDYVTYTGEQTHTISQEVADAIFKFDTGRFLNLPGGPIGVAGGFEYRQEDSANINDAFVKTGLADSAPQPDAFGGFEVKEAFAEFNLPILKEKPFFDELSLDAAYRYADYSHAGVARAWKVGGVWGPIQDLRFRGTYSKAVRAPNITEAFLPPTSTFFSVSDPCDADNIGADPDRAANCAALGVPVGFEAIDNASVDGSIAGNTSLKAESAESFTAGFILQPRFIPGLAVTLDYFHIEITDAIDFIDAQDIANNCVDAAGGPDALFCSLITRSTSLTQPDITFVESTYLNTAALKTAGWDMTATYSKYLGDWTENTSLGFLDGKVTARASVTHLDLLRSFPFQQRPTEEDILEGTVGDARWKGLFGVDYSDGPLTLGWEGRYVGKVARFSLNADRDGAEAISPSYIDPVVYHDATVRYRLPVTAGDVEVYGGVNNIFDEQIPIATTDASYEVLGRFFFMGARAKF